MTISTRKLLAFLFCTALAGCASSGPTQSHTTRTLNAAEEAKTPYAENLRYPDNWPAISAQREPAVPPHD